MDNLDSLTCRTCLLFNNRSLLKPQLCKIFIGKLKTIDINFALNLWDLKKNARFLMKTFMVQTSVQFIFKVPPHTPLWPLEVQCDLLSCIFKFPAALETFNFLLCAAFFLWVKSFYSTDEVTWHLFRLTEGLNLLPNVSRVYRNNFLLHRCGPAATVPV